MTDKLKNAQLFKYLLIVIVGLFITAFMIISCPGLYLFSESPQKIGDISILVSSNTGALNTLIKAPTSIVNGEKYVQLIGTGKIYHFQIIASGATRVSLQNTEDELSSLSFITPTDGFFPVNIVLKKMENTFAVTVSNEQNSNSFIVKISRPKTEQEVAKEQEALVVQKQMEVQQVAEEEVFKKSRAGKICIKHPGWSRDDCQGIADKKIWMGMSYDMLVELRGRPNSANPSNYGYGTQWQWCWYDYTPSCFYDYDDDGKIDSYN